MSKKLNNILDKALEEINPSETELKEMNSILNSFLKKLNKKISSKNINAEVFLGGSFAKKTLVKKEIYDADVFVRFDKKYKNISEILKKILKPMGKIKIIHGSRDYYRIKVKNNFFLEIVPVKKINSPEQAENTTDLSYAHVKYINKKVKLKKTPEQIKLAKAFCQSIGCYGAESYINGFSGYALEVLISYYKTFEKFLRELSKKRKEKLVLDIEKQFKSKKEVLMNLNSSKLESPVICVDPTFKQRNILAALSKETYEKFQKKAKEFLKNPSIGYFRSQKKDISKIKLQAEKSNHNFTLLETKTNKTPGEVAGGKLFKFYKHLLEEITQYFEIIDSGFNYDNKKKARYFIVSKPKKEIIFKGPMKKDKTNVKKFKEKHKNTFEKNNKIYAKQKIDFTLKEFIKNYKKENKKKLKDMNIKNLKIV